VCSTLAQSPPLAYDPAVSVEINITGPDSMFSYGELGQYSVQIIPSFPDTAVQWDVDTVTIHRGGNVDTVFGGETHTNPGTGDTLVDGDSLYKPTGFGTFQSVAPPLEPMTVTVTVEALIGRVDTTIAFTQGTVQTNKYRHIGYKSVVLTQRVTSIQLRCPDTHACASNTVGGTWSIWVDGFDALGHQIYALTGATTNPPTETTNPPGATPIASFVSRDTTIASVSPVKIRAANVTARKTGTTWIVATRGVLFDSLQVTVH
jgi:hypothetical protein